MGKAIRGITVEIGGNTTKLGKALEDVNKRTRTLQNELKGVNTLLKTDPSNVVLLKQKQDLLNNSIGETKNKLKTLKEAQAQVQEQFDKGEITEEQYRDFQREIVNTEQKLKGLKKEMSDFGSVSAQKIANVGSKMQVVGGKIEDVGQKMMGASAVATGAIIGATKVASDFESAWTGVTKTVNGTEKELAKIKQGILDLSQATGSSAEEIAQVAENAGQLGVATKNVMSFTETMVRLGDSTNLSADEASSAIAKLFNIMGSDINSVDKFGSSIVALGNNMATTEADILNMATRLASSGKQIGLTEQEVLALSASLSSVGLEAEGGGSAISAIMSQIDKSVALNSKTLGTWASVADMSVKDFKKLWETDAMSAIQKVVGGMGDASKGGENLNVILDKLGVQSIRQTDTMKRLSGASELLGNSVKISNDAWSKNSALTEESNKRYETTEAKIQQLKNTLTELCVKLGETLLPIVSKVVGGLSKLVNWFTNLSPSAQKVMLVITGIVAVIGPLLIAIGNIISAVGTIMTIVPTLVTAFGAIKTAFIGLNTVMSANPVGAIIVAVVALVSALIYAYNHSETFRNVVNKVFKAVKEVATKVVGTLVTFFTETLPNAISGFVTNVKKFFTGVIDFVKNNWKQILLFMVNPFAGAFALLYKNCEGFRNFINNFINGVKNFFINAGKSIVNFFTQTIPNFISMIIDWFNSLPEKIGYAIGFVLGKLIVWASNVVKWVKTNIPKIINNIVTFFKELPGKIWTFLLTTIAKIILWGNNMKQKAISAVTALISNVVTFFKTLPGKIASAIANAIVKVATWGSNMKAKAISAIKNLVTSVVTTAKTLPGKIGNAISGAINKVVTWGANMVSKAKKAITNVASAVTNGLKAVPNKVLSIGKNIVQGLWKGIQNATGWVKDKVKGFAKGILKGMKDALDIHSPSRLMEKEVGENIALGVIKGIDNKKANAKKSAKELSDLYVKNAQSKIKELKNANKVTEADEVAFWTKIQKACKKGTSAYKTATEQLTKAKNTLNNDIKKLDEQYTKDVDSIKEQLKKDIQEVTDAYDKAVSDRQSQITSSIGLFDAFSGSDAIAKNDLIDNLQSQVEALTEWDNVLDELANKKGMDPELLKDLEAMGVNSLGTLKELNSMSDSELSKYISLYNQKNAVALERAESENKALKASSEKQIEELIASANTSLNSLESTYIKNLKKLGVTTKDTSKTIGKDIVKGLQSGIKSQNKEFQKYLTSFFKSITSNAKNALKIHSPSRAFRDEVGRFIPEGVGVGIEQNKDSALKAIDQMSEDMINQAQNLNGVTLNRQLETTFKGSISSDNSIVTKLDDIIDKLKLGSQIVLDSGTLVGETVKAYDEALANRKTHLARGWS